MTDSAPATIKIQVTPDTKPPKTLWVDSAGENEAIRIKFDEAIAEADATNPANYTVSKGVTVIAASLTADGTAVTLQTSKMKDGQEYELSVRNLRDRAPKPNTIADTTRIPFTYRHIGNGLRAAYFEGPDFSGKLLGERIDPYIEVDWRKRTPFESMQLGKPFSVRWTGLLKADHSEEYMIYFFKGWEHNRNPARVWIDGKLLANEAYGPVRLEAGKVYDIRVELNIVRPANYADYYSLRWSSLSTPKQVIPKISLGAPRKKKGE
jgi:hypothetical protein